MFKNVALLTMLIWALLGIDRSGQRISNGPSAASKAVAQECAVNPCFDSPILYAHGKSIESNEFDSASLSSFQSTISSLTHSLPGHSTRFPSTHGCEAFCDRFLGPFVTGLSGLGQRYFSLCFFGHRSTLPAFPVFAECCNGVWVWRMAALCYAHILASHGGCFLSLFGITNFASAFCCVWLAFSTGSYVVDDSPFVSDLGKNRHFCVASINPTLNRFHVPKLERILSILFPSALKMRVVVITAIQSVTMLSDSLLCVRCVANVQCLRDLVSNDIDPRSFHSPSPADLGVRHI